MKSPFLHIILASCFCVVTLISYGFWYATVGAKSVAVASLESRVVAKTTRADQIASSRASLTKIANDEAVIQNYFVPETKIVDFIDLLQARGKEQEASIEVLSVSSAGTGTTKSSLTLKLAINGTFSAILRTIGVIEYAPYAITVSGLSITQTKEGWRADVDLLVGSLSVITNAP
ncbi:hypothetical protein EXS57_03485 [Candidatus Kaiserbacteria bacterium]|nr:hypothetical protein [Candidatus Kaiserbacteria bacterium]